jgi:serine/threonine protein kinase
MTGSNPRRLGRYELLRPLWGAEPADVYLGRPEGFRFDELCVVKLVGEAGDEQADRLMARARRALTIQAEGLVTVMDVGSERRDRYFAMEYVEGRDLRAVLTRCAERSAALPIEAALYVGIQLCSGLARLHQSEKPLLARRPIDPCNVLIPFTGGVKLGMARERSIQSGPTAAGLYQGLGYLAPEQLQNEPSIASDFFSLGVIIWELLVGRPIHPTAPVSVKEALSAAQETSRRPPSRFNDDVPIFLDAIVLKMLAAEPQRRHASADELKAELEIALQKVTELAAAHNENGEAHGFDKLDVASLMEQLFSKEIAESHQETKELLGSDTLLDHDPGATMDTLSGQMIADRYRAVRRIGEGGMGAVYLGEHVEIGRQVAIKVLHAAYSNDKELVKRFRQEARAAAEIGHPNIVEVTDMGTTADGRLFFVMEYLVGQDLAQLMSKQRRFPVQQALHISLQICRALHAAHEAGIVHRDLKPENIYLTEKNNIRDFVKILDFGVAIDLERVQAGNARLTMPGMAMGTPEYMAPEQAAGRSIDRRIDIYASAVMLYEMLCGRLPHEGETLMALLNLKATEPPTPLNRYRRDLPKQLSKVVMRALSSDANKRHQTMEQLAHDLERCLLATTGPQPQPATHGVKSEAMGNDPTLLAEEGKRPGTAPPVAPRRGAATPLPASSLGDDTTGSTPWLDPEAQSKPSNNLYWAIGGLLGGALLITIVVIVFAGGNGSKTLSRVDAGAADQKTSNVVENRQPVKKVKNQTPQQTA